VPPDCPVHHRSNDSLAQRSTAKAEETELHCANSAQQSRAVVRGAPDSEQYLSGAELDCPVPLEDKASNGRLRPNPNGWVTWLAHRTVRWRPSTAAQPQSCLVVEGYKYPQPPPLQPSKHSTLLIQYKSKVQRSKTKIKATDPIKVPDSILVV
jgi:hypothetical protein